MSIAAVTTFNAAGYKKYGKRMIQTYDQYWSAGVPLHVFYEDWVPEPVGIELYHNLMKESLWLEDFKRRNASRNVTHGFRHDAIRSEEHTSELQSH